MFARPLFSRNLSRSYVTLRATAGAPNVYFSPRNFGASELKRFMFKPKDVLSFPQLNIDADPIFSPSAKELIGMDFTASTLGHFLANGNPDNISESLASFLGRLQHLQEFPEIVLEKGIDDLAHTLLMSCGLVGSKVLFESKYVIEKSVCGEMWKGILDGALCTATYPGVLLVCTGEKRHKASQTKDELEAQLGGNALLACLENYTNSEEPRKSQEMVEINFRGLEVSFLKYSFSNTYLEELLQHGQPVSQLAEALRFGVLSAKKPLNQKAGRPKAVYGLNLLDPEERKEVVRCLAVLKGYVGKKTQEVV